jgi:hypothetical protein
MTIEFNIKEPFTDKASRLSFIVQLLKSLDFVEFVNLKSDVSITNDTLPQNKISELLLNGPTMTKSDENYYFQKQKHFNEWK